MPMMSLKLGRSWGSLKHCTIRLRSTAGCMSSVMGSCLLAQPTAPTTCSRQTGSCSAQGCDIAQLKGHEDCQTGLLGGQASTQAEEWPQLPLDTLPAAHNVLWLSKVQASTATAEKVPAVPACVNSPAWASCRPRAPCSSSAPTGSPAAMTQILLSIVESVPCRMFPDSGASRQHLLSSSACCRSCLCRTAEQAGAQAKVAPTTSSDQSTISSQLSSGQKAQHRQMQPARQM